MISVLTTRRKPRSYLTYDLEWKPGIMELRLIGVYDGNAYRCYRSVDAFFHTELTHQNRGKWFYAHFGGAADFQFLWSRMIELRGFTVRGSFSGSSAIIIHVTRGKNTWHFVDSFWLLHDSLRKIGEGLGVKKGNADECPHFFADAPLDELRDYNEIDCIILYRAISEFEDVLLELGGQLKMTVASCGMELFRRKFLHSDIETSMWVNDTIRKAYVASRVEVLASECDGAYYWDVNSSFPYAMTFPLPGDLIGTYHKRLPDIGITFADCTIEVPDSHLPPLPIRMEGRVFFPTGRWRGWYSNVDLELLQTTGGRIVKVHESMAFEPRTDFRDYAKTIFELRKKESGFRKIVYKYLLNCLYGKFAEDEYKSGMVLDPPERPKPKRGSAVEQLIPGVWLVENKVPVPHMHVPISAYITAIARRTLYLLMAEMREVYYCDTDGFSGRQDHGSEIEALVDRILADPVTDSRKAGMAELLRLMEERRLGVGKELGNIKLEKILRNGIYLAAKVNMQDGINEKGEELLAVKEKPCGRCGEIHNPAVEGVKAKGFSRVSPENLMKLRLGEEIEYTRMARMKEQIRRGQTQPREDLIKKRLNLDAIGKRFFYPDGKSRPWHIRELEEIL